MTGEDQIRRALASEEFERARRLWEDYVEGLRRKILRGEAAVPELEMAAELLQTARDSLAAFRARSAARLAQAKAASAYSGGEDFGLPPASRVTPPQILRSA